MSANRAKRGINDANLMTVLHSIYLWQIRWKSERRNKGEEIANLEAMKKENAIIAPFDAQIVEVCVKLNDTIQEGQLLFVIEKL